MTSAIVFYRPKMFLMIGALSSLMRGGKGNAPRIFLSTYVYCFYSESNAPLCSSWFFLTAAEHLHAAEPRTIIQQPISKTKGQKEYSRHVYLTLPPMTSKACTFESDIETGAHHKALQCLLLHQHGRLYVNYHLLLIAFVDSSNPYSSSDWSRTHVEHGVFLHKF
jgi:hypothetical protein